MIEAPSTAPGVHVSNHPEFDAMFSGGQPDERREGEQARNNPFLEIAQQAALA